MVDSGSLFWDMPVGIIPEYGLLYLDEVRPRGIVVLKLDRRLV